LLLSSLSLLLVSLVEEEQAVTVTPLLLAAGHCVNELRHKESQFAVAQEDTGAYPTSVASQ
jgi:hypothetical protein